MHELTPVNTELAWKASYENADFCQRLCNLNALEAAAAGQVEGCSRDLSGAKEYYQRYRICEDHLKLSSLIKDNIPQRFCQQCGRFHVLADFDGDKR